MSSSRNVSPKRQKPVFSYENLKLVANLRGIPEGEVSFPPKMTSVRLVGDLVQAIFKKYHAQNHSIEQVLLKNWPLIVGERYTRYCRPLRLTRHNTRLLISTANPLVRQELTFKNKHFLQKIQSVEGCSGIKEIIFCMG